jgi:RecA-family ATPase
VLEYRLKEICSAMQLAREQWEAVADGMFIEDVIDLGERARLSAVGEYGNLAFTSFMARLAERYKPIRPRLAFLDPANFFGPGERFLNDGDASLMRAMRKLSRDFGGAAVGALAHTGKAVYREGIVDQYAGRGGSAQADNSRAGLQLVPHGPEDSADHPPPPGISLEEIADGRVFRLHSHKFSYGKRETRPFWIRRDGFKFEGFEPFAPDEAERREKARAEAEALAAEDANTLAVFILRNSGHHWTKTALRESSDTIGLTWRRLSAALVWAVSHGKLVETLFPAGANSRGARCYYTVPGGAQ